MNDMAYVAGLSARPDVRVSNFVPGAEAIVCPPYGRSSGISRRWRQPPIDVTVVAMRRPNGITPKTWPANLAILAVILVPVLAFLSVESNRRSSADDGVSSAGMKVVHLDDFN